MEELQTLVSDAIADNTTICLGNKDEKMSRSLQIMNLIKYLFDKASVDSPRAFGPFTELYVDGLDYETVWEELNTRNKPLLRFLKRVTRRILTSLEFKEKTTLSKKRRLNEIENDHKESLDNESDEDNEAQDDIDDVNSDDQQIDSEEDLDFDGVDDYDNLEKSESNQEDQDDMDDIDQEEYGDDDNDGDNLDDAEGDNDDDDEEEDEDEDDGFEGILEEGFEEDFQELEREFGVHRNENAVETPFEKQSKAMKDQISELESKLVKEKNWEMKGEVRGKERPENSLLDVQADVDRASKPAPLITEQHTSSIEEMIKKRIENRKFDDVVRKFEKAPIRQSEEMELSQEKSKLGLGDVYAEEFMKKSGLAEKEKSNKLNQQHEVVKQLFEVASRELDALCHFYFTPRPVVKDVSVTSLPVSSIAMEDATPVGFNTSMTIAPQELLERSTQVKTEAEFTREDRKKRRRLMKEQIRKSSTPDDKRKKKENQFHDKRVIVADGSNGSNEKHGKSHNFFKKMEALKA